MSRKDQIISLLTGSPNDSFLLFALAKEHEKAGADAGAREVYERIVSEHPNDPGTYYHLGKLLEKMGEPLTADQIYAQGITTTKALGETHHMRELLGARLELGVEEE
ncbi:tetratricopeptide repeat protein [Neolewinella antarctica]|uniref:Flp pilus assembly protein TadD n=1 Tax=Neolewinella antarctica TaxID=442734 RepID=A0ABX0XB19_9BACT|nr:tetratricopeptide repeat protein [Neolewinella antarctica]NJC26440.1 Flp pilus assembly protein TadD [Neolewinella antarctica]